MLINNPLDESVPFTESLYQKIRSLVEEVDVDLDSPLNPDDE